MDSCLTQKIQISLPSWQAYKTVPIFSGYSNITSLTPILGALFGSQPTTEGQLQSDNLFFKTVEFEGSGSCFIQTIGKKAKRKAYCKVTHLLDPVRTVQAYYAHPEKGERRRKEKSENPMNQAYVDALANYLLGQLRERNISPHFCLFYGGFQAVAEKYRYNITDEFESYRKYKDFWVKKHKGLFDLSLSADDDSDVGDSEWILKTPASSLRSTPFSYTTHKSPNSTRSHISLDEEIIDISGNTTVELESIASIPGEALSTTSEEDTLEESDEDSEDESEDGGLNVYVDFKDYPVMLIFQEEMEGVLDDLLEDEEEVGAEQGSPEWEEKWTAWTFQIIAALCVAQGVLGFTHNDLHTNNIVWTATDQPWLFYKSRDGTVWRIPTYGKLFRLIDFGRAIFHVGDTWFVSDDYEKGGDAEGQYFFGNLLKEGKPEVYPNPSFDLCRYAVSVIDALYPDMPAENLDGGILSKEDSWEIRETESSLWNLLWSWLIDEHGKNVLKDEDGTERFPDFDLYSHISAHIKDAKPQEQIRKELFRKYQIAAKEIGDWETMYPLFC
jgi:hypothetical protein